MVLGHCSTLSFGAHDQQYFSFTTVSCSYHHKDCWAFWSPKGRESLTDPTNLTSVSWCAPSNRLSCSVTSYSQALYVVLKDLNSKLGSNQNISHLQECCRSSFLMKFTIHCMSCYGNTILLEVDGPPPLWFDNQSLFLELLWQYYLRALPHCFYNISVILPWWFW